MHKLIVLLALLAALAVTGNVGAGQPGAPPEGARDGRPPRPPIDTALDVDGDGVIEAEEIAGAMVALGKLDLNGDGQLTPDEYRPPRLGGKSQRPDPAGPQRGDDAGRSGSAPPDAASPVGKPKPPIVTALDADGNGEIDAGEIANAVQALKKLDVNGDGTLSPDEYRPPRPDHPAAARDVAGQR